MKKAPAGKFGSKEFLEGIAQLAQEMRAEIEEAVDLAGFDRSKAATAARRERALRDFRFFCETYFPHHIRSAPSPFHEFLWRRLPVIVQEPDEVREVIAAPRGNAKTTFGQLFILWCVLGRHKRYPLIISDAIEVAAMVLEGIKAELEANPRLAHDFPDQVGEGPVWQVATVVTRGSAKIQAAGAGKRIRGARHGTQRPDLVWLDDIENDENVKSPEQRDKRASWLDKAIDPLGPPDGSMDIVYVGTILHYDAVLARKIANPMWRATTFKAVIHWPDRMDLWEQWEELLRNDGDEAAEAFYRRHRGEMEAGAEVLWPAVQPLIRLMKIRVRIGTSAFNSEYQNEPIDESEAMFGQLTFWVERLSSWLFFGSCDPSLGKRGRGRDPSAILVGGFDRDRGILDVVEAAIAKRLPDAIIEQVIAFQQEYRCLRWAIESVQFQEFFRTTLVRQSAERLAAVPAVPFIDSTDKELRIASLQPHVQNGLIRFSPNHSVLLQQLRHWPHADHDDGPDALYMLWWNATTFTPVSAIRTTGRRRVTDRFRDYQL